MKLFCYTRKSIKELYDIRLANSLHLALYDGEEYIILNHNSGVLYGKASENGDGSLDPKCLSDPILIKNSEGYFVACILCNGEGEKLPCDNDYKCLLYKTVDFLEYEDPVELSYKKYLEYKKNADIPQNLPDADILFAGNMIEISQEITDRLLKKLMSPKNIDIKVPSDVPVSSNMDLSKIMAEAVYSDGSIHQKRVQWDGSNIDFSVPGTYEIFGKVKYPHFDFPVAINRADPCVTRYKGKYYFIATNDADNNHTLYIRCSDSLETIKDAPEVLLLDSKTYDGIGGLLWAPEFHEINGRLYIFHACTPGEFYYEESHVMELCENGDPMKASDWSKPKRVVRADGTNICEEGKEITLDMTAFQWDGSLYAVWSQRQFLPKDLGAWLYIAKLNPQEPWKLLSDPVVLSKPEYGWANNHTFVDEGPYALIRGDTLFLTFSSAAVDVSYVVGLLKIQKGKDLLNPKNWKKKGYPILTARCVENEWGTGHNAYVIDEDGDVWNTYHARPGVQAPRCSGIRRVHFDCDGEPVLDLIEENDLLPEFKIVKTKVVVK